MLYLILLRQRFQRLRRHKQFAVHVFMHIFLSLWILSCVIFVAYILKNQLPAAYRYHIIYKAIVPYFIIDLLLRYFFAAVGTINIYPYLQVNIPRKKLVNFTTLLSHASKFNLLSFCMLIALHNISGRAFSVIFIAAAFVMVLILNTINFLVKQLGYKYTFIHLTYPVLLGSLLSVAINTASQTPGENGFVNVVFITFPGQLLLVPVYLLLLFIQRKLIARSFYQLHRRQLRGGFPAWQLNFGGSGVLNWIILEIKLIFRNAKPRRILMAGFFTSLYWIYFRYANSFLNDFVFILLIVAISTLVSFGYGIFAFSWNWKQIDFLMTKPLDPKAMLKAKWIIIVLMEVVMLIPALVVFINDPHFLPKILYCAVYILGIPPFVTLYASIFFSRKINLNLGGYTANYEGRSVKHLIPELGFILFPAAVFLLMKWMGHPQLTYKVLAFAGIAGFLSTNYLYTIACRALVKRRYRDILKFKN